jgi:hypothetical protein
MHALRLLRSLMGTGATGLYIYDDEEDEAYWPNEFAGLFKVHASQAAHAPDRETTAPRKPMQPGGYALP